MKPIRTWILLADANRARIVENKGPGMGLYQLRQKTFEAETPKEHNDHQGRVFNSMPPTRHKMDGNVGKDLTLASHVNEILTSLENSYKSRQFDRLVLCASPQTLGALREHIPESLKANVHAEIPKNLTHIPTNDLVDHFGDVLAV